MVHVAAPQGAVFALLMQTVLRASAGTLTAEDALTAIKMVPTAREELNKIEITLIETLLDDGQTWEELGAAAYNAVSRQTMQQRYARLGGNRMRKSGPRRKLSPDQLAAAGDAVASGQPVDQVAATFNVNPRTLQRNLALVKGK